MAKTQKSISDEICDYLKKQKLSPISRSDPER